MRKKLTFMDVVKGLLFVAGMYLFLVFLFSIVHLVFEKNILNIENPLYAIIGGAIFLIFFGIIIAFSKVRQAGYTKNIFAELIKTVKGKK